MRFDARPQGHAPTSLPAVGMFFVILLAAVACAPNAGQGTGLRGEQGREPERAAPTRLVAAIRADPHTLYTKVVTPTTSLPGLDALDDMIHGGFSIETPDGVSRPQLVEALPSVENGLWQIRADGRMETRWVIREGARWHDGVPVTAHDALFSATIGRDPELPTFSDAAYGFLDRLEAPDDRTLIAHWTRPYISAHLLFGHDSGVPLPRHILEPSYLENKANFQLLPHWTDEMVSSGPFRVRDFVRGSHVVLAAHGDYPLGRPRIEIVEVRFIPNTTTMAANLLAGAVQLTLGRALSLEEALQVQAQWAEGRAVVTPNTLIRMYAQMESPRPPVLGNLLFRRALLHGIDRQQLVDALQGGLTSISYTILPDQPRFARINAGVARYDHDPARAAQLAEASGLSRGADGTFQEAPGRPLAPVEIRAPATADLQIDLMQAISDMWGRIGIPTELVTVSLVRNQDREYRTTRPAFHLVGGPAGLEGIPRLFPSSEIPTARNRWTGNNASRWNSPEADALVNRYLVTIPEGERMDVVEQIVRLAADQLPLFPLFFNVEPTMVGNRLVNVGGRATPSTQAWNAHEWEIR